MITETMTMMMMTWQTCQQLLQLTSHQRILLVTLGSLSGWLQSWMVGSCRQFCILHPSKLLAAAQQHYSTPPQVNLLAFSTSLCRHFADDSNAGPGDKTRKSKAGKSAADKGKNGTKSKLTRSSSRNRTQPHEHKHHGLGSRLYKLLFGWLDPKFRLNGKKLITNSSILWKFTVSILYCCF